VPSLLKTSSLKGTNLWQRFLDLKTVRDSTIHFKSTEPLNTYQADAESLFFQFFRRSPTEYPVTAFDIIKHFYHPDELPRWAISAERRIQSLRD
jgi:hypothetical protein